ncbi:MAG: uridine kinase [Halobacteriovoraceae bacterium]|nr:uridine kinase [Halobacteriovoraceae bacterium]|tara:strand:+ start:23386 stop:23988 length:603 start_codon:yes stop_codon:yes gene_type:complete
MYIVGIAGGSGSGKTTFAKKVQRQLDDTHSQILSMDSYYLHEQPAELRTKKGNPNFDHPGAFDWELLNEHIADLKAGKPVNCPVYDFKTNSRKSEFTQIQPTTIVLFEGIFALFDKSIRELLDIKCFLHVDSDIRFTRRLHRDVNERGRSLESVINQYYETVRPMYLKYLDPQKQFADFTVGEETDVASEILASRLRDFL